MVVSPKPPIERPVWTIFPLKPLAVTIEELDNPRPVWTMLVTRSFEDHRLLEECHNSRPTHQFILFAITKLFDVQVKIPPILERVTVASPIDVTSPLTVDRLKVI